MGSRDDLQRQVPPADVGGVWLRFGNRDVEIAQGETLIGRSANCEIVLDDPLVSRTHARIVVNGGAVTIEDLKSANGVLINGEPVLRAHVLLPGDRVVMGQQSFVLFVATRTEPPPSSHVKEVPRLNSLRGFSSIETERSEATRKGDAIDLLGGVAEKVLALGRGDEAERILSSYLRNLLKTAHINSTVDPTVAEKAVTFAVRLAETTGKGAWVDYCFELYGIVKRPLPGPIVERLYGSLRKISAASISAFREYVSVLREADPKLGPSDRFLMRRIEGLEALSVFK